MTTPIQSGEPLSEEKTREIVAAFRRDGFAHVPGVLEEEEMRALRDRTDELLDDPRLAEVEDLELHDRRYVQMTRGDDRKPFILRGTIALDPIFREMLPREPILSLAEAVVGPNCRFCGQNVLRNQTGVAIERWHVDGSVHFPVPDDVPRHDPRIPPPVLWITVQMALTDIDRIEHGPTQYVPGSHLSGRDPNDPENPEFEGRGPVSVFCKAGDIYLQDPQCWHRGAPNTSGRTRYLMQSQYAVDWAYRRFGWMNAVPVPEDERPPAGSRLDQLLGGRHPPPA